MSKIKIKITICICVFCLIISLFFSAVLIAYQNSSTDSLPHSSTGIYVLTADDLFSYATNGSIRVNDQNIASTSDYNAFVFSQIFQGILPLALAFFIFLFLSAFLLILAVNTLQEKENQQILSALTQLRNGEEVSTAPPMLHQIYRELEERFEANLNDYKRLNSYLSHEQKNLLAILRTMMSIDQQNDKLEMMDRISASIDDVLTLSEHADRSSVGEVDVTLVCAEAVDVYRKQYPDITFDFSDDESTLILAKERWIFRAVSNLIDNAIKYGEHQEINVTVTAKHHSVVIQVEDHGIGISDEKQKMIFQHRYRISELNQDGYGIGLSLVSHVCDLCGGYIFVDSTPGKGSTFVLSFPQLSPS